MTKIISLNDEIEDLIVEFFKLAVQATFKTDHEKYQAYQELLLKRSPDYIMIDDVIFKIDDRIRNAENHIVQYICKHVRKSIGFSAIDESDVSKILWQHAVKYLSQANEIDRTIKLFVAEFVAEIEKNSRIERRYINESLVLRLDSSIERFDIGPVSLVSGNQLAKELKDQFSTQPWDFEVGKPGMHPYPGNADLKVVVGQNNWDIKITAARANLAEEAAWLAGIAISLLRLTAARTLGPHIPRRGEVEPHPFSHAPNKVKAIIVTPTGISEDDTANRTSYLITQDTLTFCRHPKFQEIITGVFESQKNSIGERIKQSLGWQARARQSKDRAEKMLYFFTALESILSHDNNSVTDTIARNAASILSDEPEFRERYTKMIKKLYDFRSRLVHNGIRKVTDQQAYTIQSIAERVCCHILDQVRLNQPTEDFKQKLREASTGLSWYYRNIHLLPEL